MDFVKDIFVKDIAEILKEHKGKKNAISAGKIEKQLLKGTEATHSQGRKLIKKCIKKTGLPVGANNKGYFLITNKSELKEYVNNIDSRIKKMQKRIALVVQNFNNWNK